MIAMPWSALEDKDAVVEVPYFILIMADIVGPHGYPYESDNPSELTLLDLRRCSTLAIYS